MDEWLSWALMLLFGAHLAGFAVLGWRRREWYYLALVLTFGVLTGSFALRLVAPDLESGGVPLYLWLRYAAWGAAAVSISWTALRMQQRRRN
ncbi:MAG: hypothetical protein CVV18_07965 [Gammaproteobacteria bacterium HGW-Gammaproteobacteria-8]|nr:MAG: hypothetical protein CVV18_07965 [Gammaproteobacteria bacterium HGW-Gammaproteobacteria-8]